MPERVFVGMSGGVDSALAASLLVEAGFDVTGIYMRNWSQDLPGFKCPWAEDLADAERVAVQLGIPLEVWDYEAEYKRDVVDYLVDSYNRGLTPNPDVMCNEKIKFGIFAAKAFEAGADYIATGHYAQVGVSRQVAEPFQVPLDVPEGTAAQLLCAADTHKDQTYFLWRVGAEALARTLFPIGSIADKQQVRALAAERGLEVAKKPDSQGICFIGPIGLRQFLLTQIPQTPGDVVEWETGQVLGRHEGAFLFTVGQRKGLDLGGGPARYVVSTDTAANTVTVTSDVNCPALWTPEFKLTDVKWVAGAAPEAARYLVRSRHTGALVEAFVEPGVADEQAAHAHNTARIVFEEPVRTVAPGQSVVIYSGGVCLGGGILI